MKEQWELTDLETMDYYPSLGIAAKELGIAKSQLYKYCKDEPFYIAGHWFIGKRVKFVGGAINDLERYTVPIGHAVLAKDTAVDILADNVPGIHNIKVRDKETGNVLYVKEDELKKVVWYKRKRRKKYVRPD